MANNENSSLNTKQSVGESFLHSAPHQLREMLFPSTGDLNQQKHPDDLISHSEMCQELGISPQTGFDWRNPKSKRYKADLASLAIYLSERTVRFKRVDIQWFALQRKLEGK